MPIFPTGYDENTSPTTSDKILVAKSWTNKTEYSEIWNLPFPAMQADTFQYKTFVTVGSTNADYTTIQDAIDDLTNWGLIYPLDGTHALPTGWLLFKYNYTYIVGNWEWKCDLTFDGAVTPTAIKWNVTNLRQCGIAGVNIIQTNGTVQGTAIDMSDIALSVIENVQINDAWLALKLNDTANNTFYNDFRRVMAFGCTRGIEFNGSNVANENRFYSCRIANKSGGDYGLYMAKGQGNKFYACDFEPAATTGNTGVYITSANSYSNHFDGCWIEWNNVGVLIDSSVTYNWFKSCTITNNTTNFTNNGKYTSIESQIWPDQVTLINPLSVVDKWNASSVATSIINNTSFAHVSSKLVSYELLNGSDTSKVLEIKNAGSWNSISVMQWASEVMSVSPAWKLIAMDKIWVGTTTTWKKVTIDEWTAAANFNGWITLSQNAAANVGTAGLDISLLNSTANITAQFRGARTAASAYVGTEINSVSRDGFRIQTGSATAAEVFRIGNDWKITVNATNTAGWTTGNQTINKTSWTVNIAAAWTAVTVTNSLVTTSSIVLTNLRTNDATATIKNVVPWSGSFVINLWAAATAEVSIWFFVIN